MNYNKLREEMVFEQILKRGIYDKDILEAFKTVPRHLFVPLQQRGLAYSDCPLAIGQDQTISQPYIVALMTKSLEIQPDMSVLEVGTGSGYQAAIMAFLGVKVYSIERIALLAKEARKVLDSLGYQSVQIKVGDGTLGWKEYAPYDRIIVTAASMHLPKALVEQVKVGGKIIIPLGERFHQDLTVVSKISKNEIKKENICGCIFVPLIGEGGWNELP
ncbi:MAG: protein-L-isoaspartate(D-aspartate) O-methyltransferase [Candidatus Omnitrophica bacterium]|nr:protein-L-isoaspartate(D-aspartate) O-methyltransferase [Candidatus Omnitrophota bacterium]